MQIAAPSVMMNAEMHWLEGISMIQFRCKAYENIMMFDAVAHQLITFMGHSGVVPGAIKAKDTGLALQNLQHGLAADGDKSDTHGDDDAIPLPQRAFPLIQMLKFAHEHSADILWDYY